MIQIRQAGVADTKTVSAIFDEASEWLESRGMAMWRSGEVLPERVAAEVREGRFFLAEVDGEAAGVIRFQLTDPEAWPDVPDGESAYIHRLAIRRRFTGGAVSHALLKWAVQHTAEVGRPYLRMFCEASRYKLRELYERFGFVHHSDRQMGVHFIARYELRVPGVPDVKDDFLKSTDVIDWQEPSVRNKARELARGFSDPVMIAKRCFEWVRDEIHHSSDFRLDPVTCSASEVLREGTGYCYAKSHLLAALLRANGVPAGLCYQRLSRDDNGPPYSLHGLNAVRLPGIGWYRIDPRGNRVDVDAQFTPPVERLAFAIRLPGEKDIPGVRAEPLPVVVRALRAHRSADDLFDHLPDI